MKFENIRPEGPGQEGKQKKEDDRFSPGRRDFLKFTARAAAVASLGVAAKQVSKTLERFGEPSQSKENNSARQKSLEKSSSSESIGKTEETQPSRSRERDLTPEECAAQEVCQKVLTAYNDVADSELWPADLFTDDLFIAQQLAESNYDHKAESGARAVGVMQTREICKKDVVRYINKLDRNKVVRFSFGSNISESQLEDEKVMDSIMELVKTNPDYSRAFGKIYMCQLQDTAYGYGVGAQARKKGDKQEALKQILASYNAGASQVKGVPEDRWFAESRNYYKRIFGYMDFLSRVRTAMSDNGLNGDNNEAVMLIVRKAASQTDDKRIQEAKAKEYIQEIKRHKEKGRQLDGRNLRQLLASL